ncbi:MAG TPA: c-type cytochrome biogenesis protein CcsB [Dermatophilaceae bacterium]|nr:c-type cytochrome biogenesis protein CcsB [Dermatophilaceae bacterium]
MTNQTLSEYSDLALSSAMFVFTIAMVAFAVDLARTAPRAAPRAALRTSLRTDDVRLGEPELVAAGGGPARPAGTPLTAAPPAAVPPAAVPPAAVPAAATPAPPRRRRAAGIGMSTFRLGSLVLLASVVMRGLSVMRPPWGNMFEFSTAGALAVCAAFFVMSTRRDLRWLGLFVTFPVLITLGLALLVFYTEASELLPSLKSVWLVIHVAVAILSVGVFTVAFSVVVLQLIQARWEASDRPLAGLRARVATALPDSRSLERTAYGLHVVAFPMWTFTVIAGAIWAEQAWGRYWNWDPKEVASFVVWVVYAAYLHARATTGWSTRRANYLAVAGFAALIANFTVVNMFAIGMHAYSGM